MLWRIDEISVGTLVNTVTARFSCAIETRREQRAANINSKEDRNIDSQDNQNKPKIQRLLQKSLPCVKIHPQVLPERYLPPKKYFCKRFVYSDDFAHLIRFNLPTFDGCFLSLHFTYNSHFFVGMSLICDCFCGSIRRVRQCFRMESPLSSMR